MFIDEWIPRIKAHMSDYRFYHTLGMTTMTVSLAWKTAILHDIAKGKSREEMIAIAEKYGHKMSDFSLRFETNMHAEVGALIAEHEFGLSDSDALNAIRFHVSAHPDMSILEKIIFFSDHAEPSRPNQAMMIPLYEIAKTNLDLAILRMLNVVIEYQIIHDIPTDICEICTEAYDFLLDEYMKKDGTGKRSSENKDMLSDDEFDDAFELIRHNHIKLKSVENARWLKGFITNDGRKVKDGLLIRSGDLAHITDEEADYLKNTLRLSLVIDLRTPSEIEKAPNKIISGIQYENIPLTENLNTSRMDYLTKRYLQSQTENEKSWYTEQFARISEVIDMYRKISTDVFSLDAIQRIFRLLIEADGAVLFHCTSGKDRTGIIAALILYALGCRKEDILNDYNASAVTFFSRTENIKADLHVRGYNEDELKLGLQTSISVVPEVLGAGFYYIENNYTSQDSFMLESIGLSREDLESLRNKYLSFAT